MRWIATLSAVCALAGALTAQSNKPDGEVYSPNEPIRLFPSPKARYYNIRMKTSSLGIGGIVLKDEYLSPLNYGGFSLQYSQESNQLRYTYSRPAQHIVEPLIGNIPREANPHWLGQRHFVISLGQTKNPAGNGSISRLQARLSGSRQYRLWDKPWGRVYIGPGYTVGAGGLYSSRNGNNPATLKLDASLGLACSYSYRLPWQAFPALFRLSLRTDLVGLNWGQQFGESYYELYYVSEALAKRFAFAHLGNSLGQEVRLDVSLPLFDRMIYNIGYRYQHKSWRINQIYNSFNEHSIQVGITRYIRPLGGRAFTQTQSEALPF